MASGNIPPAGEQGFPNLDHRFRDMRDKMNRDREAFFNDSGSGSGSPAAAGPTPSSIFGRESPFFRVSTIFFLATPTL